MVSKFLHAYLSGVQDAISLHNTLLFYIHSRQIRICTAKCIVLNGIIFLGSIFFFDYAVIPVIHRFGDIVHRMVNEEAVPSAFVKKSVDMWIFVLYQVYLL